MGLRTKVAYGIAPPTPKQFQILGFSKKSTINETTNLPLLSEDQTPLDQHIQEVNSENMKTTQREEGIVDIKIKVPDIPLAEISPKQESEVQSNHLLAPEDQPGAPIEPSEMSQTHGKIQANNKEIHELLDVEVEEQDKINEIE